MSQKLSPLSPPSHQLPFRNPIPNPRRVPHTAKVDPELPVETHGARLKCCGFLKVLLLVQCKVSLCLLPGHCAAGSRGLSLPPCVLSQGHLCASGFPSSQALPPFTLYLRTWHTALEPICVRKCLRDVGTSLNILHVSTKRIPSARWERVRGSLFFGQ